MPERLQNRLSVNRSILLPDRRILYPMRDNHIVRLIFAKVIALVLVCPLAMSVAAQTTDNPKPHGEVHLTNGPNGLALCPCDQSGTCMCNHWRIDWRKSGQNRPGWDFIEATTRTEALVQSRKLVSIARKEAELLAQPFDSSAWEGATAPYCTDCLKGHTKPKKNTTATQKAQIAANSTNTLRNKIAINVLYANRVAECVKSFETKSGFIFM